MRAEDETFEGEAQPSVNPQALLVGLRRQRLTIAIACAVALVPVLVYAFTRGPTYQSVATVAFQGTPQVLEFGADFMPASPQSFARSIIPQMMTLTLSDNVLGRVVDNLWPVGSEASGAGSGSDGPAGDAVLAQQLRAQQIDLLRDSIALSASGGETILNIAVVAGDAASTAAIANATADALVGYLDEQRRNASRRAISWLGQKISEVRDEIRRLEEARDNLVTRAGVAPPAPSDSAGVPTDPRSRLTAELEAARLDLLTVEQELARVSPSHRAAPRSPEQAALVAQLAAARTALSSARLRYTPTHPEVQRLDREVQSLSERVGDDAERAPVTEVETARVSALEAQRERLQARVGVLRRTLQDLTESESGKASALAEFDRLEREIDVDRQMLEVLLQRANQTNLSATAETPDARVLDYAVPPLHPLGPNRGKLLAVGFVAAISAGFAVGFGRELLDRSVRDPDAVSRILGCPYLGPIPDVQDGMPERQGATPRGVMAAERYRNLRTVLQFLIAGRKSPILLLTSALAGEGKSTVSANLAASFAGLGRRVVLVDADLRRPRQDKIFAVSRSPGLAEVLAETVEFEDAVQQPIGVDFTLLPSGEIPPNPSELLGSARFDELLERLRAAYDLVLIDSPVLLAVSDSLLLAARADYTLLVYKPGSVDRAALSRMRSDLERASARLIGFVFNRVSESDPYLHPTYLASPYVTSGKRGS